MNYIVTFVCLCFVFGVRGEHKHASLVSANRVDDKPRSMELEQLQQHVESSRFTVAPASLQLEKRQGMGMPLKLVANDLESGAYFGISVALSSDGNTALIGARYKDEGGLLSAGASYIFTRTNTEWSQQMKLVANDLEEYAYLGSSVALSSDGNTALIGARGKDEGGLSDAGTSYIFTRTGTEWSQQMKLVANDLEADARFGWSAALSSDGNTALIGAYFKDEGGLSQAGASYIFTRTGTEWSQQMKLVANDLEAYAWFGFSAALSSDGNTALIGAYYKNEGGLSDTGASYIFTRTGTEWSQQMKLVANDLEANAWFGFSAALSSDGNTALIGAHGKNEGGLSDTGASYIFTGLLSPTSLPSTNAPTGSPTTPSTSATTQPATSPSPTTARTPDQTPPGESLAATDPVPTLPPSVPSAPNYGPSPAANTAPAPALTSPAIPVGNSFPTEIPGVEGDSLPIIIAVVCVIVVVCLLIVAFSGSRYLKRKRARLSPRTATHMTAVAAVDGSSNSRSRSASASRHPRTPSRTKLGHTPPQPGEQRSRTGSASSRRQSRSMRRASHSERRRSGSLHRNNQSTSSYAPVTPGMQQPLALPPPPAVFQTASPLSSPTLPSTNGSSVELYGRSPGGMGVYNSTVDSKPGAYGRTPGGVGVLGYSQIVSPSGYSSFDRAKGDDNAGYSSYSSTVDPSKAPFPGGYVTIIPTGHINNYGVVSTGNTEQFQSRHLIPLQHVEKQRLLGSGNFGEVWHGDWKGVEVAVKQIKGVDRQARQQLMSEAQQLTQLRNHPNVVSFYGIISDPLSVVIEFCPGGALDEALYGKKPKQFNEHQLLDIARGIALGVAHLHDANVVHRDLAARNVLLSETNAPKVTDFGMSRIQTDDNQHTQTKVGPIKWMSPEQLSESSVSKKSDVWAYGVVLFEMFTRSKPWAGQSNVAAAGAVMRGEHLPIPDRAPPLIRTLMEQCFGFDPNQRPTAEQLAQLFRSQSATGKRRSVSNQRASRQYDQPPVKSGVHAPPGYVMPPRPPASQ